MDRIRFDVDDDGVITLTVEVKIEMTPDYLTRLLDQSHERFIGAMQVMADRPSPPSELRVRRVEDPDGYVRTITRPKR